MLFSALMHDVLKAPPVCDEIDMLRRSVDTNTPPSLKPFELHTNDPRTLQLEHYVLQCILSLDDAAVFPPPVPTLIEFWGVWGNVRAVHTIAHLGRTHTTNNPFAACDTAEAIDALQDTLMDTLLCAWRRASGGISKVSMYRHMWRSLMDSDPCCVCELEDFKWLVMVLRLCDTAEYRRRSQALCMGVTRTGGGRPVLIGSTRCATTLCPRYGLYKDHQRFIFLCAGCGI